MTNHPNRSLWLIVEEDSGWAVYYRRRRLALCATRDGAVKFIERARQKDLSK